VKIKEAFLNSLYAYLEGLVHLVFTEYTPLEPVVEKEPTDIIHKSRIDPSQMVNKLLFEIYYNVFHCNLLIYSYNRIQEFCLLLVTFQILNN
jgi:hypothetical protein